MFGDSGLWIWNPPKKCVTKLSLYNHPDYGIGSCLGTSTVDPTCCKGTCKVASEIRYVELPIELPCSYSELNCNVGSVICFWKVICFWMVIWTASELLCQTCSINSSNQKSYWVWTFVCPLGEGWFPNNSDNLPESNQKSSEFRACPFKTGFKIIHQIFTGTTATPFWMKIQFLQLQNLQNPTFLEMLMFLWDLQGLGFPAQQCPSPPMKGGRCLRYTDIYRGEIQNNHTVPQLPYICNIYFVFSEIGCGKPKLVH